MLKEIHDTYTSGRVAPTEPPAFGRRGHRVGRHRIAWLMRRDGHVRVNARKYGQAIAVTGETGRRLLYKPRPRVHRFNETVTGRTERQEITDTAFGTLR